MKVYKEMMNEMSRGSGPRRRFQTYDADGPTAPGSDSVRRACVIDKQFER